MNLISNVHKGVDKWQKIKELLNQYAKLKNENLWFYYDYYEPGTRPVEVRLKGKNYILFSTNNYLGLSKNRKVINSAIEAAKKYGIGTGASFAVTGGTLYHELLADALKKFYNYEAGIVLSSGYMANSAVITAFAEDNVKVFFDKYLHISFIKAFKLHGIESIKFEHNDVNDLYNKIKMHDNAIKKMIITESLFSQHGNIAKINKIATIAKEHKAILVVDDAHGLGTIGKNGYGILEHCNLTAKDIHILTGAMNKSLGSNGGYILSSRKNIDLIKMKSHELIFTSSLPAMSMAAAHTSLQEIKNNKTYVQKLKDNVIYFRTNLINLNLPVPEDITPIIPLIIGSMDRTCKLSMLLKKEGIIAIPIIPPAVPIDACRIRFQITSEHTKEDIDRLLKSLKKFFYK
ncbi:MAG: aminotransferase class I/II-fold pyridoxal phosphate-dependent enzyme [Candidatus Omnitrophica bacterium]|nr:aminotransferase class I/II-fold pyridoxal phosphate-dependent enzyme [Candidatus Omnitrophota bacterium]